MVDGEKGAREVGDSDGVVVGYHNRRYKTTIWKPCHQGVGAVRLVHVHRTRLFTTHNHEVLVHVNMPTKQI